MLRHHVSALSPRTRSRLVAWLAAALAIAASAARASTATELPGELERTLRAGIDRNFAGDWDGATREFQAARALAPDHPAPAFFLATPLFWRIELDPADTRHDEAIASTLDRAVALAGRRLAADPDDLEALAWGGQAIAYQSRREAQRGNYLSAGTLGERARKWQERALALAPAYPEPKPSLGAYLYISDLVPRALKWLSFLWFVPKGDAARGLGLLDEAAASDGLGKLGAQYTLLKLGTRFEPARRPQALQVASELRARFPGNALVHLELVRLLGETGDVERALAEGDAVRDRVASGIATYDARVLVAASLWQARAALLAGRLDDVAQRLGALAEPERARLSWANAWHGLTLGQLHDARGNRAAAVEAYECVIDLDGPAREPQARTLALLYLDEPWVPPLTPRSSTAFAS